MLLDLMIKISSFSPSGDCGKPTLSRVIGGIDAKPGSWPWQVRTGVDFDLVCNCIDKDTLTVTLTVIP